MDNLDTQLHNTSIKEYKTAMKTLVHCLDNILTHTEEEKYNTLNINNPHFYEKLGKHDAAIQLLIAIGFNMSNDGQKLTFVHKNMDAISVALALAREKLENTEENAAIKQRAGQSLVVQKEEKSPMMPKRKPNNILKSKITSEQLKELHISRKTLRSETKLPPAEISKLTKLKKVSESNVPEEEPPSIFPPGKREFNIRDIEELRKHDILKAAKDGTRNTFLDQLGQQALQATNEFRKEHGLSELLWHQGISLLKCFSF
jgi:hypothetical protein